MTGAPPTAASRPSARPAPSRARPRLPSLLAILASRFVLFGAGQALVAALLAGRGHEAPWAASAAWWPVTATLVNLLGLALLAALYRREGASLREAYRIERGSVGRDLVVVLVLLGVGVVVAMGPNLGLATLLWGDPEAPLALFVQPLPAWAAWVALLGFPLTIAAVELPTYHAYLRPRLERAGVRAWAAIVLAASFHSLQHVTLPFVPDARFVAWRGLMFLPFALLLAAALRWRPRLLPYLVVAHGLLDAGVGLMVWQASLG